MKKYVQPEACVVCMNSADLITASGMVVNNDGLDCGYTSWGDLDISLNV